MYFTSQKQHISFIRSGCTMLDCALGGGWAVTRISNIAGDKSTGKTQLAMEAMAGLFHYFADAACWYDEPESSFDSPYARALQIPIDRVVQVAREKDYKRSIEEWGVRIEKLIELRLKKGTKGPGLHITDSLDSLSDDAELNRELTDEAYGGKKAAKLSEFFRKNIDGIREANMHLMIISQIRDVMNAASFGKKTKRSGGHALDFYAAQCLWLTHTMRLTRTVRGYKMASGIRVKGAVEKNKVGLPLRVAEWDLVFAYGIDDEKASRDFLDELKVPHDKLSGDELRAVAMREWFDIERALLPSKPKYPPLG